MKKLFLILFLFLLWSTTYAQLKLPELSTTEVQAAKDLEEGNTNEEWFSSKDKSGNLMYKRIFKNTPVGIKHGFDALAQLKSDFNTTSCKDESLYSLGSIRRDSTVNFDILSSAIRMESAEINKSCAIKDNQIIGFNLKSIVQNRISYLELVMFTISKGSK